MATISSLPLAKGACPPGWKLEGGKSPPFEKGGLRGDPPRVIPAQAGTQSVVDPDATGLDSRLMIAGMTFCRLLYLTEFFKERMIQKQ